MTCAPCDVFAIALPDATFAFGRVMATDRALGNVYEFFAARRPTAAFDPAILASGRPFPPLRGSGLPFEEQHWTVVHADAGYVLDEQPTWASPAPAGPRWCVVDRRGKIMRHITAEEGATLERGWFWTAAQVEERLLRQP